MRARLRLAVSVVLLGAAVGVPALADHIPPEKAVIVIDHIQGDRGAVTFPHQEHSAKFKKGDGQAIACKDCHHTLAKDQPEANETVVACSSCHAKPGASPKAVGGKTAPVMATMKGGKAEMKSIIFHQVCLDCHKKSKSTSGKSLASCKTCHTG